MFNWTTENIARIETEEAKAIIWEYWFEDYNGHMGKPGKDFDDDEYIWNAIEPLHYYYNSVEEMLLDIGGKRDG